MKRELNGVLIVDKAPGMSSANVVARAKKILNARKVGHAGTLDPFAEGLMILCFGKATKLASFFLHGEKTYEARIRLGIETDTQDSTGRITAVGEVGAISPMIVSNAFEKFKGTIRQLPPVYSALKHKGVPLYKLARKGKPVQKPAREVRIYDLDILDVRLPHIEFRVTCSGGAYVRTLAADIGKELGSGGHLDRLKRIWSGGFSIEEAVSFDEIEKTLQADCQDEARLAKMFVPMAAALRHLPEYMASDGVAKRILDGVMLEPVDFKAMGEPAEPFEKRDLEEECFKIVDAEGELLAVACRDKVENRYKYRCVFPS